MEVEYEQLAVMKKMKQYGADKPEEDQKQNGGEQPNAPLDLGFPEDEPQAGESKSLQIVGP